MRAMRMRPPPGESVWVPSSMLDHAKMQHFGDFELALSVCRSTTAADAAQEKAAVAAECAATALDAAQDGDRGAAGVEQGLASYLI